MHESEALSGNFFHVIWSRFGRFVEGTTSPPSPVGATAAAVSLAASLSMSTEGSLLSDIASSNGWFATRVVTGSSAAGVHGFELKTSGHSSLVRQRSPAHTLSNDKPSALSPSSAMPLTAYSLYWTTTSAAPGKSSTLAPKLRLLLDRQSISSKGCSVGKRA